jgi:hypothetical protein
VAAAGAAAGGGSGGGATAGASAAAAPPQLQLLHILGTGSFGAVWLAMWRGKKVAVKVMQLPADALLDHSETLGLQAGGYGHAGAGAARRRGRGKAGRQGAAPHMAIMEAVLSSTMSHPNVVQVAAGAFGV